ncbi:hypothetical protein GCM10009582_06670 [Arthrobacter flavus]
MNRMQIDIVDASVTVGDRPADVDLIVAVTEVRWRGSDVVAFRTTVEFAVKGTIVAKGIGDLKVVDSNVYARIRKGALRSDAVLTSAQQGVPGELVGRLNESDVALKKPKVGNHSREWEH